MDKTRYKGYYIKLRRDDDKDVIAILDAVSNRQDYLRGLVRQDMTKEEQTNEH